MGAFRTEIDPSRSTDRTVVEQQVTGNQWFATLVYRTFGFGCIMPDFKG